MSDATDLDGEPTYSLGAVTRLTGLSPHVLRAWERRYGVVRPLRTPGGTRRYREVDVLRLRRLRDAVAAGHPIGEVAGLSEPELARRLELEPAGLPQPALAPILTAIEQMDGAEAERLLGAQLSTLGGPRFVRLVASPLLTAVGERWANGRLCVASEHLASTVLRSLLGPLVRPTRSGAQSPPIVFATPPGERHELGALMAAIAAAEAGGHPVYLGPDLPVDEVVRAASMLEARAVALGVCHLDGIDHAASLRALRASLPDSVEIWVGGRAAVAMALPEGVALVDHPSDLDHKVALLAARGPAE
jgi:DNA-binding transcriptional MerR regulator